MPADIVLCTLNAKYFHASLGLRYLLANLGDLQPRARIREFIASQRPADVAEQILAESPRIVGIGTYIWNAEQTAQLVAVLKAAAPHLKVVLGGPEVSYEWPQQPMCAQADHLVTGQADLVFAELCRKILAGEPCEKVLHGGEVPPDRLQLPYDLYDDEDVRQRLIYVEASRGCPFKCEFCLSALDTTSRPFALDAFLAAMARLHLRGVRHFKLVDRTFNLAEAASARILQFFLDRLDDKLFLHFELVPDRLPPKVAQLLGQFPAGQVQLEIGIQSFDPATQARISRRQDHEKTLANLRWLRQHTGCHLHVDLIAGLPGEDLATFGAGFDQLVALDPHEIQVGLLKRLRGAPIARHTDAFGMRYDPRPPYTLLCSDALPFADMQRISRFARYWDMLANSGRFTAARVLILGDAPFARFLQLSDWIYANVQQTHEIALERLFSVLYRGMVEGLGADETAARQALLADYAKSGLRGEAKFWMAAESRGAKARAGNVRQGRFSGE